MNSPKLSKASFDALLLTFVKLITIVLSFTVTRLLSQYLSIHDYGTYSQILLLVSTITMGTILGMVDGTNFFFCSTQDLALRESYISTLYLLQGMCSTAAGILVLLLSSPLCTYFKNSELATFLIFAATIPILQNLLSMTHVLVVSVGKARLLAIRNLLFSFIRLCVTIFVSIAAQSVAFLFIATLVFDFVEFVYFWRVLKHQGCCIHLNRFSPHLIKRIFRYCLPMAAFTVISALSRDLDKYTIALFTDTETLAIYTNASKPLPFDIITTSFCTVLVPHITTKIAQQDFTGATALYKAFLKIAYISTGVLCCAALSVAPQLMELLYSSKYLSGLPVFFIYILVDLLRFTNITLILAAAGKTRLPMYLAFISLIINAVLNPLFYYLMGSCGPAIATLIITLLFGSATMVLNARELHTKVSHFFDKKDSILFILESVFLTTICIIGRNTLASAGWHHFIIILIISGGYAGVMTLLNGKSLIRSMRQLNHASTAK